MKHTHPIKAVVFDIDGTLALMDKSAGTYKALPGAVEAVVELQSRGLPVVAYTNGTFFTPEHYAPRLAEAGFQFASEHIITPATVAAKQLAKRDIKRVMLIGGDGTREPLERAGLIIVDATAEAGPVDAVLLSFTPSYHSSQLDAAAQAIWNGVPLFATSIAPHFPGAKGKLMGVSGAIAAALTHATGVKPEVFGKPSHAGLEIISELIGLAPHNIVVVGDDPNLEIAMARKAGALAIGVLGGTGKREDFSAMPEDLRAQLVLPSLQNFMDEIALYFP